MTIRAILFDHDGTLVDSEPIHHALWVEVLARYGVELTAAQYRDHYAGVPTKANALDLVDRFAVDASAEALEAQKNAATVAYLSTRSFPLMPGVRETVTWLHGAGLMLGVVTGASGGAARRTLDANALTTFFATVVSGDDVRFSKPAPDCYLLALERLGLQPAECLAVEDTEHGVAAAVSAGVPCIAVPTEMSRSHDFSGATGVADGMHDVGRMIRKRLPRC